MSMALEIKEVIFYILTVYFPGGGLGAFLGHIVAMIPHFLASAAGQKLISAGKDVIRDVKQGSDLKTALKKTGRKTVKDLTGLGRRKTTIIRQDGLGERRRRPSG